MQASKTTKSKKAPVYTVDLSRAVTEEAAVVDPADFEKYLKEQIKVNNKKGNLGTSIVVSRKSGNKVISVEVKDGAQFAKRYLKWLTRRYLHKNQLGDYMHVIANSKNGYELKYFKVAEEAEEEEGDE